MDARDYNDCVKEWSDALFRFARRCTGSAEDAQDAVQTAFAALWEARNRVEVQSAKAWLFQVAYRQSVNAFNHNRRQVSEESVAEQSAAPDARRQVQQTLNRALDKLDEQSRALVLLKDWEGYKYEEIGRITGLTDAQVRVYLHRARKQLKADLVSVETVLNG
jgi:RNA polymerase sigma-70 factor (ECF subfamily)